MARIRATISEEVVAKLEEFGGKRWTKGECDRIYFSASKLGVKTRRISSTRIASVEEWQPVFVDAEDNEQGFLNWYKGEPGIDFEKSVAVFKVWVDLKQGIANCYSGRRGEDTVGCFLASRAAELLRRAKVACGIDLVKEQADAKAQAEALEKQRIADWKQWCAENPDNLFAQALNSLNTTSEETSETTSIIEIPLDKLTNQAFENISCITKAYEYLLGKATGFTGLEATSEKLVFAGMDATNDAHRLLVDYLVKFAMHQKQVRARETLKPDNEKFAFRTWLLRMGWKGRETSKLRMSLYKGLNGNTAFCTAESKTRWVEKHGKRNAKGE